jgi:hypothetical protein
MNGFLYSYVSIHYTHSQYTLLQTYPQTSKNILKVPTAVAVETFLQFPMYGGLSDQELSELLHLMLGHVGSVDVGEGTEGLVELLEFEAAGGDGAGVGQGKEG